MTASNFAACLRIVLKHEGGYVDHPRDPGGATNLGVTIDTWSDWIGRRATKTEMRALTVDDVTPLYRRRFWDAVGADNLPPGVDLVVFDAAVNSGPSRARQWYAATRADDPARTIRSFSSHRMGFLRRLRHWATFGRGWTRRVVDVERRALEMASSP